MRDNINRHFLYLFAVIIVFVAGCAEISRIRPAYVEPKISEDAKKCINCHQQKQVSNLALRDWQLSVHAEMGVTCIECHIPVSTLSKEVLERKTLCENKDVQRVVSPKNCEECHEKQVKEFGAGKHAVAWKVLQVIKAQQDVLMEGENNCAGCHRIGRDDGKCDTCHTRHRFSAAEARRPEACRTCHTGEDHPQWEMYNISKHGAIYAIEGKDWYWNKRISEWYDGLLLESPVIPRAPVCVTCHMENGSHAVKANWGFLSLRLFEKDKEWEEQRNIIFKGLGYFDKDGKMDERFKVFTEGEGWQLAEGGWEAEREKMIDICSKCHSKSFSKDVLEGADTVIKKCDELMAKAINIVDGIYNDGIIQKSEKYIPHIDTMQFYRFNHPIEERLYNMFLRHRMTTYLGAFHINPAYQHGYGVAEMQQDLREIEIMAKDLRMKNH